MIDLCKWHWQKVFGQVCPEKCSKISGCSVGLWLGHLWYIVFGDHQAKTALPDASTSCPVMIFHPVPFYHCLFLYIIDEQYCTAELGTCVTCCWMGPSMLPEWGTLRTMLPMRTALSWLARSSNLKPCTAQHFEIALPYQCFFVNIILLHIDMHDCRGGTCSRQRWAWTWADSLGV